jgi:hypothetical protein
MQGPTDEASIPTKYVVDSGIVGVRMRRKNGIRTYPWPAVVAVAAAASAAAGIPTLPLPPPLPPPEDDELPAAKKPRLQVPTRNSTSTADGAVTTHSPYDTPPDPVTPATKFPSATASSASRRRWNEEEDAKLTEGVKKYGSSWGAVAAMVPGRTNEQCRFRWLYSMNSANDGSKGKTPRSWEPEEDANLMEGVKKHGYHWTAVAKLVPGRKHFQCRYRWLHSMNPANGGKKVMLPRKYWQPKEDTKLTEAVRNHGQNWNAVSAMVPGRANRQCRQRWVYSLCPDRASNTVLEGLAPVWSNDDGTL